MELDPARLTLPERYKLLIGAILPRPIALVSTVSPEGRPNLAPFSFFAGVGSDPMTLLFCPVNKPDGTEKDTLRNAKPAVEGGSGEFVVNLATEAYARSVAGAAEELPYGENEFDLVGLSTAPSRRVRPPRVARSPLSFECRTLHLLRLNPGAPGGGNVIVGEVVFVHAAEGILDDALHVDPDAVAAIGRLGGDEYCTTRERFSMQRGRAGLNGPGAPPRR